jgi:hypothetical protein
MKENCATLDFHEISRAEGPNRHTRWASFLGFGHNLRMTMEQLYVRHDEVDRFNARMPPRYGAFVKGIFGSPLSRTRENLGKQSSLLPCRLPTSALLPAADAPGRLAGSLGRARSVEDILELLRCRATLAHFQISESTQISRVHCAHLTGSGIIQINFLILMRV